MSPPAPARSRRPHEKRRTAFSSETELFGALRSVPLLAHTPGHTGFIVSSDGETLLIWADIVHHATFRFAHPEWGPAFDVDSVVAVSSRKRAFDHAGLRRHHGDRNESALLRASAMLHKRVEATVSWQPKWPDDL